MVEKKVGTKNEMVNGSVNETKRLTGEAAHRRKRVESINESDMTMAERLGL